MDSFEDLSCELLDRNGIINIKYISMIRNTDLSTSKSIFQNYLNHLRNTSNSDKLLYACVILTKNGCRENTSASFTFEMQCEKFKEIILDDFKKILSIQAFKINNYNELLNNEIRFKNFNSTYQFDILKNLYSNKFDSLSVDIASRLTIDSTECKEEINNNPNSAPPNHKKSAKVSVFKTDPVLKTANSKRPKAPTEPFNISLPLAQSTQLDKQLELSDEEPIPKILKINENIKPTDKFVDEPELKYIEPPLDVNDSKKSKSAVDSLVKKRIVKTLTSLDENQFLVTEKVTTFITQPVKVAKNVKEQIKVIDKPFKKTVNTSQSTLISFFGNKK